jgi:hypothetical protein
MSSKADTTVTIPFELDEGRYSTEFLAALRDSSAWSREARIVVALAAARRIRLDESELLLDDVTNLRARRDALIARA